MIMPGCDVYWGSHGCHLERGHEGHCECDCCECEDHARDHEENGCAGKHPYYGPHTRFYGDDVERAGCLDVKHLTKQSSLPQTTR